MGKFRKKPDYYVGDTVYLLRKNEVVSKTIQSIIIKKNTSEEIVNYKLVGDEDMLVPENQLFYTKDELREYLLSGVRPVHETETEYVSNYSVNDNVFFMYKNEPTKLPIQEITILVEDREGSFCDVEYSFKSSDGTLISLNETEVYSSKVKLVTSLFE